TTAAAKTPAKPALRRDVMAGLRGRDGPLPPIVRSFGPSSTGGCQLGFFDPVLVNVDRSAWVGRVGPGWLTGQGPAAASYRGAPVDDVAAAGSQDHGSRAEHQHEPGSEVRVNRLEACPFPSPPAGVRRPARQASPSTQRAASRVAPAGVSRPSNLPSWSALNF